MRKEANGIKQRCNERKSILITGLLKLLKIKGFWWCSRAMGRVKVLQPSACWHAAWATVFDAGLSNSLKVNGNAESRNSLQIIHLSTFML